MSGDHPTVPVADVIAELERELAVRRKCYPRWLAENKIKPSDAAHRLACQAAAVDIVKQSVQPKLL